MITPRFSCSQTEEAVIVSIYCPSVRASDIEINVDERLFTIHINPYYLRLYFSHPLEEDDESSARYDPSSGYVTITLTKAVKGQQFNDLDLLAKLLAPPPSTVPQGPLIEVIDSEENAEADEGEELADAVKSMSLEQKEILDAAENEWTFDQQVPPPIETTVQRHYGFLDMHSGYFRHVEYAENEVNDLGSDAETCTAPERRARRTKRENEKWDEEYYLADFADDEYIKDLIAWEHPFVSLDGEVVYTEEENLAMLRLPRKEYLPTPAQTAGIYHTLLTILFSHAYDARTTQHDPTSESGWTISILTPAFSALDPAPYRAPPIPSELAAVFTASYRRCFAFPLYRSFALAEACRADVAALLVKGKRTVLRCLLEVKSILDHHDVYYVYSKIWMDDLCVWIQSHASDDILRGLAADIANLKMEKRWIGWDLDDLEALARGDPGERASDSDDESSEEEEVEEMLPSVP
ncbi:hypothetical protein EUX98_g349 [Antrodiella citrinella]|uniref:CS domain-containing protein n=1 Tax=Antrodiella citrinella TaxID=2447956 RepID=A0A4S4ND37_9APHY|nr:hypothetical protein EUX98_g349 [Antrodiella citrinella]